MVHGGGAFDRLADWTRGDSATRIGQKKWFGSRIGQSYDVRKFLQPGNPGEENTPQLEDCFMSTDSDAGQYSKEHMINVEENEKKKMIVLTPVP